MVTMISNMLQNQCIYLPLSKKEKNEWTQKEELDAQTTKDMNCNHRKKMAQKGRISMRYLVWLTSQSAAMFLIIGGEKHKGNREVGQKGNWCVDMCGYIELGLSSPCPGSHFHYPFPNSSVKSPAWLHSLSMGRSCHTHVRIFQHFKAAAIKSKLERRRRRVEFKNVLFEV